MPSCKLTNCNTDTNEKEDTIDNAQVKNSLNISRGYTQANNSLNISRGYTQANNTKISLNGLSGASSTFSLIQSDLEVGEEALLPPWGEQRPP